MFHLVNSVYVKLDTYMDRVHPHYNISSVTGYEAVVGDANIGEERLKNQLGFWQDIRSMAKEDIRNAFKTMLAHKDGRMMVWVCPGNYAKLYASQLLAMTPDMSLEEFRLFMIMAKVKYDTSTLSRSNNVDALKNTMPLKDNIGMLYNVAQRVGPIMRNILYGSKKNWSLEYRVRDLLETGEDNNVSKTMLVIQKRNIISNAIEALNELQYLIGEPKHWDKLGCDQDTLLSSKTVFHGCLSLNELNSDWLLSPDPYNKEVTISQLSRLSEESTMLFQMVGDNHMVDSTNYYMETLKKYTSGEYTTIDLVIRLFGDLINGSRVNDKDSTKYNVSMIKWFLKDHI